MYEQIRQILSHNELRKHEIMKSTTDMNYYRSELRTYPDKKDLVTFAFEHAFLWDDVEDALFLSYLQTSYLVSEERLQQTHYLPFLFLEERFEFFFHLSPQKVQQVLGEAALEELLLLQDEDELLIQEDWQITFHPSHYQYKELVEGYLNEHGFEALSYTFEDVIDPDHEFDERLIIYLSQNEWPSVLAYVKKLIPSIPDSISYHDFYPWLMAQMEKLIVGIDYTHAVKTRYLANLRRLDKGIYIGMDERIERKRKEIAALQPNIFKHLKRWVYLKSKSRY